MESATATVEAAGNLVELGRHRKRLVKDDGSSGGQVGGHWWAHYHNVDNQKKNNVYHIINIDR